MTTTVTLDQPVHLDLKDGLPAGFDALAEHWLVTSADADEIDYIGPHSAYVLSWRLHAQTEAADDAGVFLLRRRQAGWLLESATFA